MGAGRRRVLISAYACGPGEGSEPGSGWQIVRAAAVTNDVWLVTRRRFATAIEEQRRTDPSLAQHLHVTYLELGDRALRLKRGSLGVYWYYVLWQRRLGRLARQLHAELDLDLAHHATFASDWLPVGLLRLPPGVPIVWGPVGGATYTPRAVRGWLGRRARLLEAVRERATRVARRVWGDAAARRAALVVTHNEDVATRFAYATTLVEPNPALTSQELDAARVGATSGDPASLHAVFVGRLVSWKGTRLAVDAIARNPRWTLDLIGAGPEREHLVARAARAGVANRVRLRGPLPRADTLVEIARADALLLPSMHDSASWVTAESVTLGTPVVCLDIGGPPLVMDGYGVAVTPGPRVTEDLARALDTAALLPRRRSTRWLESRLPALLDAWYALAQRASAPSRTTSR
ncbi:glycosyltransferase [Actinotalea sp. BY-33]|uniref:Glycosyltransferase n=1 Tax=Actinotalea soli TaxID=2819234 RepID=A0A939LMK3_9CELL|nr:glycosyltransferase [Actinotalea soli]MBO1750291.1 glycosyltransferase [Actinotalea soli]